MQSRIIKSVVIAALAMSHCAVRAEDIDLFVDNQTGANQRPNVLFIIDNTANWTRAFENEKAALAETFLAIPVNEPTPENPEGSARFNVGVMFAAETSSSDSNVSGGYVRAAVRPMTPANKILYSNMIAALDVGKDKGNGGAASLVMAEAYRYFSGGAPYAGNNKAKADYTDNSGADWSSSATTLASLTAMQEIYRLEGNALPSKGANRYNAPTVSQCGKNYIIYISNGPPQDSTQTITQATAMLAAADGDTTPIPLSPTGSQSNVSDEWARFMNKSLGVVTYAIDVDPSGTGQGPGWTAALWAMSETVGGGRYIGVDSTINAGSDIKDAVEKALAEIQSVNSVFASVSLPVSTNAQGTFSNQIYIGMFRPHANAYPRWSGNLKQYQLGRVGGVLRLVDAEAVSAINPLTGFITECARSFWTPTATDDYWTFRPGGACPPENVSKNSNSPDGNVVEKGAQGYVLRSTSARTLKTCAAGSCSLANFDADNASITAALLGVTEDERVAMINWARGQDTDNEDSRPTTIRASVHADVVHSRPVAIDFGTSSEPKVVVFYGGNDGVFRAINGNQTASIAEPTPSTTSHAPGSELWGFVPPEFYGQFKRLRNNSVQIDFPNVTATDAAPKPYGVDGPITAFRGSTDTTVFATMRRGGRALYAFDVPNDNPATFELKWRKGCQGNFPVTGTVTDTCDPEFDGIGQTWSSAKPFKAAGHDGGASPLLIMGGGYDTCEDNDPHTCTSSSKGNKVYVLDATDGSELRTFDTERSVIADLTIVPDSAGLAKYAYTADLGGNVYRVNIGTDEPADWTMTKIASLGCDTTASCPSNRKFMFAPDVLDTGNGEYIVLLGSGDREKPLLYYAAAASVTNYFFMLRDKPGDSTWLATESTNCDEALLCLDSLLGIAATAGDPTPTALAAKKGWYLGLRSTEQVVTSAITIFGTVTFSTHKPDVPESGSCTSKLGEARVYNISYLDASSQNGTPDRSEMLPPDTGLPPSPVAGMVDLGGDPTAFCIGCGSTSSIEAEEPPLPAGSVPTQPKGRVYWYIQR